MGWGAPWAALVRRVSRLLKLPLHLLKPLLRLVGRLRSRPLLGRREGRSGPGFVVVLDETKKLCLVREVGAKMQPHALREVVFQAVVGVIERIRHVRAIDVETADRLLRSFSEAAGAHG